MLRKLKSKFILMYFFAFLLGFGYLTDANAGAVRSGFNENTLPANDDGSTALVPLNFEVNFYGLTFSSLYVNNNGNVTFDLPLSTYTPFNLTSTATQIIAPFFADVDTRGVGSDVVTYSFGTGTVSGRDAFGVNWVNVGYYSHHADKLNSFQLVIIDRSDIAPGDFDFEFNYDQIQWESGGGNGLGGSSARAGYSNGTGLAGTFFELSGSAVNGAFLDSNSTTGLIHNSLNSEILGRYVFQVRSGVVSEEFINLTPESATNLLGVEHTVTATIQDNNGNPIEGREVTFLIVSGPHEGWSYTDAASDSNGEATFTYTGIIAGTDVIEASFINSQGQTITSTQVTKTWESPVIPTPEPSPETTPSPSPSPESSPEPTPQPSPTEPPTAVELIYFKVTATDDGSVTLKWRTATEVDNAGFNIYRSKRNGGSYTQINSVLIPAEGNSTSDASYSYEDTPGSGAFYYKLEDVDGNGVSTMHGPVKVRVKSGGG